MNECRPTQIHEYDYVNYRFGDSIKEGTLEETCLIQRNAMAGFSEAKDYRPLMN